MESWNAKQNKIGYYESKQKKNTKDIPPSAEKDTTNGSIEFWKSRNTKDTSARTQVLRKKNQLHYKTH